MNSSHSAISSSEALAGAALGEPDSRLVDLGSHRINIHEWRPELRGAGSSLLLLHATGFHGRVWDEAVAMLPEMHIIAWDMRGHGLSDRCDSYAWGGGRDDLIALLEHLELQRPVVAAHSMGGWCAMATAVELPDALGDMLLIDPVIMPPEVYETAFHSNFTTETHPVSKRRNDWGSWEEMRDRFKDREPFSHWSPASLDAYCRYGVVAQPDSDRFMLACPPEVEATFYTNSSSGQIKDFERVKSYVRILRARAMAPERNAMDFSGSPTWEDLAKQLPNADDVYLPERRHLMLMEDPAFIAGHIRELLQRAGRYR